MFMIEEAKRPMTTRKLATRVMATGFMTVILILGTALTASAAGGAQEPAQQNGSAESESNQTPAKSTGIVNQNAPPDIHEYNYERTFPELMFTLMVIALAIAALAMQFFLLKKNDAIQAEDSLRTFGVTLIIIGTLFFITAGFDSEQIAPALGLFGTIAGYLLGRNKQAQPHAAPQKGRKIR